MNNKQKPNIICMGILDTKGDEIKFLAKEITRIGANVKIMDLGLGAESSWADIPLTESLILNNISKDDVFKADRTSAVSLVGEAGAKKILSLYKKGEVDGVIAWGGGMGTSVATIVMRALPIGVPKIMMSTLARGNVGTWLGNKDIYIMNPIAEKGINKVTRKIVSVAAAAIVGMSCVKETPSNLDKPLSAITAYGTTTPTVIRCSEFMKKKGWDTIIIHQVGTGATMEDLIRSGDIKAVFDITLGELTNTIHNTPYGISNDWDGDRLTAACEMGIPQVVSLGGLDQILYGKMNTIPQPVLDDYIKGLRISYQNSKKPFMHNYATSVVSPTLEETKGVALDIITKLNITKGPTVLMVPMRGWSAYDQSRKHANIQRGWPPNKGDAPVWWPDPKIKNWSLRAVIMWKIFEENIDSSNVNLDIIKCDMHILDYNFADLLCKCMMDIISNRWHKGLYRDIPGILQ